MSLTRVVKSYCRIAFRYFFIFLLTVLTFNHFIQKGFGQGNALFLIFWGLPVILVNSAIIFYILRKTEKNKFYHPLFSLDSLALLLQATMGSILMYSSWEFFSLYLSIPPSPALIAGALAGSFWNECRGQNWIRNLILNLCIYLSIILFFGIGLHHGVMFVDTKIYGVGRLSIVSARKIERNIQ